MIVRCWLVPRLFYCCQRLFWSLRIWQTYPLTCMPLWFSRRRFCSIPFCPCCMNSLDRLCLFGPCSTTLSRPCPVCSRSVRRKGRMVLACRPLPWVQLVLLFVVKFTFFLQVFCPKWLLFVFVIFGVILRISFQLSAFLERKSHLDQRMCHLSFLVTVILAQPNFEAFQLESTI